MNIIINHQRLLNAVRVVEHVAAKNNSLPILNGILLKTDQGRLRLSATNLEIGMHYWIGAKIEAEGELVVPARLFSEFIQNIHDEKITLTAVKNTLQIQTEKIATKLLGMDSHEFPIIPSNKTVEPISINRGVLKQGLSSVLDSASLSELRPELSGIFLQLHENKIIFAATDSFRLAEQELACDLGITKQFIIPRTTAIEIIRIIDSLDEDIEFELSENQFFLSNQNFQFVSRLIDGRYPDYKRIIPNNSIATLKIPRQEFEKTVRLASIFSSTISDITLRLIEDRLEIFSQNTDRGELNAAILTQDSYEPFAVSMNYRYLLDGLKSIRSDNVILEYTGEGNPLVLKNDSDKNFIYIIMPLRS